MSRVIAIRSEGILLQTKYNQLLIKDKQGLVKSLPFEDIGTLLIENVHTAITSFTLKTALENNVVTIICDEKHLPLGMLVPLSGNVLSPKRMRKQLALSDDFKSKLWARIVSLKIKNQSEVISAHNRESGVLLRLSENVKPSDNDNKEATAARTYWGVVFNEIDKDYRRSDDTSSINSSLNYCYSIVRSAIARNVVASGFCPVFSLFHESRENYFALVDDLIEPYRPFCDLWVKNIYLTSKAMHELPKARLIEVLHQMLKFKNEITSLEASIERTVNSYLKCIENEVLTIEYPDSCSFQVTE